MVSKDGTQQLIYYIEKGQYVECYGHVILFFECHEKHFDCCETILLTVIKLKRVTFQKSSGGKQAHWLPNNVKYCTIMTIFVRTLHP